jgi:hypothetical protein
LWRDRLLISLAPGSVALARVAGLARIAGPLRARIVAKQALDCDPDFGAESWHGAAATLAAAIDPLRRERMNVTVVLSNEFVRYAIVPFDSAVVGQQEELALARFHFTKLHGERAKGWELRMSEGPRGAPRLASAVDAELIGAVRACFPRGGALRLVSVQPYLMSAFNLWRRTMTGDLWLLLVEPRRACLALVGDRKWRAVHASRGEFPEAEDWAVLLDRQRLRTDAAPAGNTVLVHAPAGSGSMNAETHGWKFRGLALPALEGFLPLEDGRYTVALTAR